MNYPIGPEALPHDGGQRVLDWSILKSEASLRMQHSLHKNGMLVAARPCDHRTIRNASENAAKSF